MTRETVRGLAEAIENRRRELDLTSGALAEAAGVTMQGLAPLRRGERRQYQDRLVLGVCRALRWQPDSIDRLMRGEPARPIDEPPIRPDEVAEVLDTLRGLAALVAEQSQRIAEMGAEVARLRRQRDRGSGAP